MGRLKIPEHFSSWLEIDLDALTHNYRFIEKQVAPAQIIAVIKANAIGHGSRRVANALLKAGAKTFAVSNFMEGMDLRERGFSAPVLVMNGLLPAQMRLAIENDLSFFGFDEASLGVANEIAKQMRTRAKVHLKVDTGMGRLGILPSQAQGLANFIKHLDWVSIEGVASHMASPYIAEHDGFSRKQIELFRQACDILDPAHRALWHFTASVGTLRFPEAYFDAVRFQGLLLGLSRLQPLPWPLKPVLSYKSRVIQVKDLPAGHNIGYALHCTASCATKVAIVPVGWTDGLTLEHADTGVVLIGGVRCRILGTCSCEMVVDVSEIPETVVGDEVVLIGEQKADVLSAYEFASLGNSSYTMVLAKTSLRNPRVYLQDGRCIHTDLFGVAYSASGIKCDETD